MRYVGGGASPPGCIFCDKPAAGRDVEDLILVRAESAFVIMNLFPYNTGHVMIVPYAHVAELDQLDPADIAGTFGLLPWVTVAQRRALGCEGFNIGMNLGEIAGAGVADHLHVHVVPRWAGDTNFMPVLANTKVLPELIPVTYAKLRAELEVSALAASAEPNAVPQAGAVVVMAETGRVAVRRTADGSLVLPKGHIEPGEAAWKTAVREVEEEMGLLGQVTGWAGAARFEAVGKPRLVAFLVLSAEPGPRFAEHLGHDTLLMTVDEALAALSHASSRDVLRQAVAHVPELFEVAR